MFGAKVEEKRDLEVYSIYDNVTQQYNIPSYYMNQFEAIRTTERMFKDPRHKESLLVTNSEDYSLFHIGFFDRKTGSIEPLKAPKRVLNLHELKASLPSELSPTAN